MTDSHRFSVSAAAAVVREDGKVLAIKRRDNGHWEPPGGVVEPGETIAEALRREVEEETGFLVEVGPLTGVYQNMVRDIVALFFRCELRGGQARTSDESSQVQWLSVDELIEAMDEAYAVRITDALDPANQAAMRAHNGQQLLMPNGPAPDQSRN